jgi:hypothetical protein
MVKLSRIKKRFNEGITQEISHPSILFVINTHFLNESGFHREIPAD